MNKKNRSRKWVERIAMVVALSTIGVLSGVFLVPYITKTSAFSDKSASQYIKPKENLALMVDFANVNNPFYNNKEMKELKEDPSKTEDLRKKSIKNVDDLEKALNHSKMKEKLKREYTKFVKVTPASLFDSLTVRLDKNQNFDYKTFGQLIFNIKLTNGQSEHWSVPLYKGVNQATKFATTVEWKSTEGGLSFSEFNNQVITDPQYAADKLNDEIQKELDKQNNQPSTRTYAYKTNSTSQTPTIDAIVDVKPKDKISSLVATPALGDNPEGKLNFTLTLDENTKPINTDEKVISSIEGEVEVDKTSDIKYKDNIFEFKDGVITGLKKTFTKTEVEIPTKINGETVTKIGTSAFKDKKLTKVTLPETLTEIQTLAFANNQITEIKFDNTTKLTTIGDNAFENNKLTSVKLPASLTSLGKRSFMGNDTLSDINLSESTSITKIPDSAFKKNALPNKPTTTINNQQQTTQPGIINSLTIPNHITHIEANAFENAGLQEVKFAGEPTWTEPSTTTPTQTTPDNSGDKIKIQEIGNNAFNNNYLKKVYIPKSITKLGTWAFGNNELTWVEFNWKNTEDKPPLKDIGDSIFWNKDGYVNSSPGATDAKKLACFNEGKITKGMYDYGNKWPTNGGGAAYSKWGLNRQPKNNQGCGHTNPSHINK